MELLHEQPLHFHPGIQLQPVVNAPGAVEKASSAFLQRLWGRGADVELRPPWRAQVPVAPGIGGDFAGKVGPSAPSPPPWFCVRAPRPGPPLTSVG